MSCSSWRRREGNRWQPGMMVCHDSICPQVLGRKSGRLHALCYQFGGNSHSALSVPARTVGWCCLAVDKLSEVELQPGDWHSAPRTRSQTCSGRRSAACRSSAVRTMRQILQQQTSQDNAQRGDGVRVMPLGANRAGGSPAHARAGRDQYDRRGQRGKKGSAQPPGTHKMQYTAWHGGEIPASYGLRSVPVRVPVSTPHSPVR